MSGLLQRIRDWRCAHNFHRWDKWPPVTFDPDTGKALGWVRSCPWCAGVEHGQTREQPECTDVRR